MGNLSKSFSWFLIAKFSQGYNKKDPKLGRQSAENLQKYFVAIDFKQAFSMGLLDNCQAVILFRCEENYLRLYSRGVWYVRSITMQIFKWTLYFRVDKEFFNSADLDYFFETSYPFFFSRKRPFFPSPS